MSDPRPDLQLDDPRFWIRLGRPEDAMELARLHVAVWRATYRDYAPAEALTTLDENRRLPHWQGALSDNDKSQTVWVGENNAGILGAISVGPSHHEIFAGRLEIKHLYVAQKAQGRGYGRNLLQKALNSAGPGVALAVVRQNSPARQFYRRMGGTEIGQFTDPGPLWRSENIVVAWD